jgi:hypothetical protein
MPHSPTIVGTTAQARKETQRRVYAPGHHPPAALEFVLLVSHWSTVRILVEHALDIALRRGRVAGGKEGVVVTAERQRSQTAQRSLTCPLQPVCRGNRHRKCIHRENELTVNIQTNGSFSSVIKGGINSFSVSLVPVSKA